jgi:hypothetical protein
MVGKYLFRNWLILLFALALPVQSEEVVELVDNAKQAYTSGRFVEALDYVDGARGALIRDLSGQLQSFLPSAKSGWVRKHTKSILPANIQEGGFGVSTFFDAKQEQVRVSIMVNSPEFHQTIMLTNNPSYAEMSGMELTEFDGRKAIVYLKSDGTRGSIRVLIGTRAVVVIEGWDVTLERLQEWGELINFGLLEMFFGINTESELENESAGQ